MARSGSRAGARAARLGILLALTTGLLAAAAPPAWSAGPSVAPRTVLPPSPVVRLVADSTTTTTSEPVTTTAPSTTLPVTSTTSSTVPASTSTRPVRTTTTTTTAPTTTTTTPRANTSSNPPWALIVVIIVLVLAIVLVLLLMRSRRRKGLEAEWRRAVVPATSDAQLARESLLSGNAASEDAGLRGAVAVQVERAATALEAAARRAPDPESGSLATEAAGSLRGLAFAVEADRLLRHGAAAPTGVQLAQADEARRARTSELNTALARLSARIGSGSGSSPRR